MNEWMICSFSFSSSYSSFLQCFIVSRSSSSLSIQWFIFLYDSFFRLFLLIIICWRYCCCCCWLLNESSILFILSFFSPSTNEKPNIIFFLFHFGNRDWLIDRLIDWPLDQKRKKRTPENPKRQKITENQIKRREFQSTIVEKKSNTKNGQSDHHHH